MELFISFHPGSMGNFLKMLIDSGESGMIFGNLSLRNNEGTVISKINADGEVIRHFGDTVFDTFLTGVFFPSFSDRWLTDPSEVFPTVCRLYSKYEGSIKQPKFGGSHLHTSLHHYDNDTYSVEYMYKFINQTGFPKILFITINNKEEYNICKSFRKTKRLGVDDTHTLEQHIQINTSLKQHSRVGDIFVSVTDIFNKNKLKLILTDNFKDWDDTLFDTIYDSYMGLQTKGEQE